MAFVVTALICFAVSVAFNVFEWLSGTPWPVAVTFAYQLVVITGFALAWFLLSYYLKRRPIGPLKTFWTTLLLALLAAAVIRLMVGITAPENVDVNPALLGFGYDTGVPLTFATVVKMHVVSSLRALLAFYLLLRFQDLVLFKRTKQSQRNWYLMLISMGVFSLVAILKDPAEDPGRVQFVALMPVIILMILNAFRVSVDRFFVVPGQGGRRGILDPAHPVIGWFPVPERDSAGAFYVHTPRQLPVGPIHTGRVGLWPVVLCDLIPFPHFPPSHDR